MPCDIKWQRLQIGRLEGTLSRMRLEGIPEVSTPYKILDETLGGVRASMGFKIPRPVNMLMKLYGFSPGTITLWHDAESGFMSEARVRPGAPPIYKPVSDEIAMSILKDELTHEMSAELMKPVEYYGE